MGPDDGSLLLMFTVLLCGLIGFAMMYGSYKQLRTAVLFEDSRLGVGALLGFFTGVGFVILPVLAAANL